MVISSLLSYSIWCSAASNLPITDVVFLQKALPNPGGEKKVSMTEKRVKLGWLAGVSSALLLSAGAIAGAMPVDAQAGVPGPSLGQSTAPVGQLGQSLQNAQRNPGTQSGQSNQGSQSSPGSQASQSGQASQSSPASQSGQSSQNFQLQGSKIVPLIVVQSPSGDSVRLFVPVYIQGQGPFPFALDTGASSSVIDSALVDLLSLPKASGTAQAVGVSGQVNNISQVNVSNWRVGNVSLPAMKVASINIPNPGSQSRYSGVAGLIGSDILNNYGAVVVDYRDGVLILNPSLQVGVSLNTPNNVGSGGFNFGSSGGGSNGFGMSAQG